jgi:inner membrane transporter RhtA
VTQPTVDTPAAGSTARPATFVLAAIASVQIGAAIATRLFPEVGPVGTVTLRLVTAAVILLAACRPRVRGLPRAHLLLVTGFGLVLGAMNLAFYAALDRIPLGVAVTLEFTGPLALAVIGSRRARDLIWIGLGALGVVLLTGGGSTLLDGSLDPVGVALALIAAAGWAGYILLSQRVGAVLPGLHGLALALTVSALAVAPWGITTAGGALVRPHVLLVGAAVGVLSSALPWALELVALRSLATSTFGVLMSLEPAVAALAGLGLLHERLSALQTAAITLTCLASAGAAWDATPAGPPTATPAEATVR